MKNNSEISKQIGYAKKVKEIMSNKYNQYYCYILTFGCQQNEADSKKVSEIIETMGYEITNNPNIADLILVNTCAVREHAELKELSKIGQFKIIQENRPNVIIGVFGCMVSQKKRIEQIRQSYYYVNFSFDSKSAYLLPQLIFEAITKSKKNYIINNNYTVFNEDYPTVAKVGIKSWLPIMYGCNNFCSYCIVPYVRGRETSRPYEEIINDAKIMINSGAKDITLLGQNVNSYGNDLIENYDISDLLNEICKIDGDFKVRFMTSHPKDVSDKLIYTISSQPKIIKHFHLPIQSGSNDILKKMNRKYDVSHYMNIIDKLKSNIDNISLSTDIIVGFPNETDDDFKCTLDVIKEVEYDMIFSFIFSPRSGTPAYNIIDKNDKSIIRSRFQELIDISNKISLKRNMRFVGNCERILIDSISKTNKEMLTGRFDSPRPVHISGDKSLIGKFVNAKIVEADTFSFKAKIL